MSKIRTICVYCGSGAGADPTFVESARQFGRILAENNVRLVFGGGTIGIMGELSRSVLDHGGKVTGIIPAFLIRREGAMERGEMIVTRDLHERKQLMFDRADAFVALPGGIGTLEELVEQMTWAQLGRHKKPIVIANLAGFWNPLCALLDHMAEMEFIRNGLEVRYLVADRVDDILPKVEAAYAQVGKTETEMTAMPMERT